MAGVKWMFLLINFQGFYLGSVCQQWMFPYTITALIGSCVEIPCRYRPAGTSGTSSTVWYLFSTVSYPEILNTGDSSLVMAEYRDRTSLVPGENSCSLRIDPVRRGDGGKYYYPGIYENKVSNAYDKQARTVLLNVTDIPGKYDLQVPPILTEGKATIIRCTAEHTCRPSPPSLQWNKPGRIRDNSVYIPGGTRRAESMLTYVPSYLDDGTPVQCTATYPNGQKTERLEILNINYAPKNVTVTVTGNSELIEGSDITLQCNSFSNPAVYEYEWYKGKTKLPDRGREITVRNVTWDMEPYSCAAINHLGRGKSAPTEIPVQYESSSSRNIIILATIGTICSLLLVFLVYFFWRKRSQMSQTRHETTYTDLIKNDIGQNYEQFKTAESPEATYTDLIKSDVGQDYDQLKFGNSAHITIAGGHEGAAPQYENIQSKN